MRDSIGGTLLFWIVLFLFSLFIIFIAFIIKYARVYKTKNSIINYIEKNEGIDNQQDFEAQLIAKGYPIGDQYKICRYLLKEGGGYYYLELYSVSAMPVVGKYVSLNVKIKGETRTIKTGTKIRNDEKGGSKNGWFYSSTDECRLCTLTADASGKCSNVDVEY